MFSKFFMELVRKSLGGWLGVMGGVWGRPEAVIFNGFWGHPGPQGSQIRHCAPCLGGGLGRPLGVREMNVR